MFEKLGQIGVTGCPGLGGHPRNRIDAACLEGTVLDREPADQAVSPVDDAVLEIHDRELADMAAQAL